MELKAKQTPLQNQERFIESIINLSPDIIYIYDLIEQTYAYMNDGIHTIFGYSVKEIQIMGNNVISILMHPEDFKTYLEVTYPKYSEVKDNEHVIHEFRMKHKNGDWYWLDCSETIYLRDSDGKPKQIFGVIHDITGRKQKEDLLKESSDRWQATFDGINDSVFVLDPNGIILQVNKISESLFGNKENMLGRHCHEVVYKMDCNFDGCPLVRMKLSKKRETMLLSFNNNWFEVVVDPIFDENNNIKAAVHIITDITERKLAEEALRESETKSRTIMDAMSTGFMIIDSDTHAILDLNPVAIKMFGTQRGEIIGNVCHKFICPAETGKCPITDLKQTIDNSERALLNNDGIKIPIIKSVVEITLGGRNLLLENFTDITEQKHTELIIQQQNKQLQELNSTKDKFFSIIAHDLKSPFLGFLGLTQTIAEDADKLSVKELVQLGSAMHQAADNLFKLLQNLLEWARLQSGSISLVPKDISLSDLIAENVETIKKSCEVKGISLNNIVTDRIHAYADEKMINSVLLNLLSNAVKFTSRNGTITVSAKEIQDQMIEVSISDKGVGMPKSMMENMFKIGEKTGRKGTDGELSTGLGLMLCKEFVEKNGGNIRVESEEGKGSTFYFTLPLSK